MMTRSGRVVKKPERFSPNEKPIDDFQDDEYDSEDPNGEASESEFSGDSEEEDDYESSFIDDDEEEEEEPSTQ
jgi:hypothetical protein